MNLKLFINRPVLSTVISIFIVILGAIGLSSLPLEQYPSIAPPTVMVRATYTGANAQTVMNAVIEPLEEQINGVEGMDYMTSTAAAGSASITVTFKPGTNPDMDAVNVQNRVSQAQGLLPSEVTRVGVTTIKRQTSMLMAISLVDTTDTYSSQFLDGYMSINVLPEIKRVTGVGEAFQMASDYSMRIWLQPDKMAQYNLMPSDITAALSDQNIEAAPGSFGENGHQSFEYDLRYKGRLSTPQQFDSIVVRTDGDNVLYLTDVAKVELGSLMYSFKSTANGHPGSSMMIMQSAGSNAFDVINNILAKMDQMKKELPKGMTFVVPMNTNVFLSASIHEVEKTLIEAFILVFLVVYIFLQDLRSTIIPAIAIPVALIGTFALLYLLDFSINLLTLSALVLAIAIVVDDAIVVVEAVHAKLDEGYHSARQAAIDAMAEIGSAIVSITLVMMLVFIPVSFMPGVEGTFYKQFGLTMAFAIGISAINALTLSPALCAVFLKPHKKEDDELDEDGKPKRSRRPSLVSRFHDGFNKNYDKLLGVYRRCVQFFIRTKWLALGIVAVVIAVLIFLMNTTSTGFVPNEDTGTVMISMSLPPASGQDRTIAVADAVDKIVGQLPEVDSRMTVQGYSLLGGQGNNQAMCIVKLKPWDERERRSDEIIKTLYMQTGMAVKDGTVMIFAPPMVAGYGASSGFTVELQDKTGGDINKLFQIEQQFCAELMKHPEVQMAYSAFNPSYPQYMVNVDEAKAARAGLGTSGVLATLQGYYGGMYVSNFNRFGKIYRVMLQADPAARVSPETLNQIKVRTATGMTPITDFVSLSRVYAPQSLSRFNMYSNIEVTGTVNQGYSSGQALKVVEEVASKVLPTGYGYEYSGLSREEAKSTNSTTTIFILCLLFVYLILSALYESYILPLAVILSVPMGLFGSFVFANIFGVENNIYLKISLIMLIGLLAKNAILIIQFSLERRRTGMSIVGSAVAGAQARLRPILMTSLAMIIGLLPLMLANGVGANGNRSLGTGAVGGMLIGTILQVLIVPTLFVIFQSAQEKIKPLRWKDKDNSEIEREIRQYTPDKITYNKDEDEEQ
ncbi:MAG: efflux RND transporter permease subunit [Sodaliphilus pleomorphus]|uniref:efflux RND transporter permease subunit n=1 Tax=Sodaliphilus pleomorphus TaxID=2606626 RepID=UPI0024095CA3|nr:efflux RND transporter permease subunit [Sodaliphilus pleomorphus]MDD6475203.1 efflux RND transporter permease subunit [Sodaliphilus pleomorphus]MDD6687098.1 efflux RND transporter permease subunit [Sodaliphilus pleomorphus]MDY6251162.1 efflux RND transporter permease subunit [Bacteroidales bacterium]